MATMTGLFTIGRDAELRVTHGGTNVVQLTAAYNYGRKGEDGKRPTQWLRLSMFGKQAEALQPHLTKGKQVSLIIRDLHVTTFEKQDRTTGTALEGVADVVAVLDRLGVHCHFGSPCLLDRLSIARVCMRPSPARRISQLLQ